MFRQRLHVSVCFCQRKVWLVAYRQTRGTQQNVRYIVKVYMSTKGKNGMALPSIYLIVTTVGPGQTRGVTYSIFQFLCHKDKSLSIYSYNAVR